MSAYLTWQEARDLAMAGTPVRRDSWPNAGLPENMPPMWMERRTGLWVLTDGRHIVMRVVDAEWFTSSEFAATDWTTDGPGTTRDVCSVEPPIPVFMPPGIGLTGESASGSVTLHADVGVSSPEGVYAIVFSWNGVSKGSAEATSAGRYSITFAGNGGVGSIDVSSRLPLPAWKSHAEWKAQSGFDPALLTLQISIPMSSVSTNPPPDESGNGHTPTVEANPNDWWDVVNSATIQSGVVRPGKAYAGFSPAPYSRWCFGAPAPWNSLHDCSFAIECWCYLPTGSLNADSGQAGLQNIIYGGGCPDSGAPRFGVELFDGVARLAMHSNTGSVPSSVAWPFDTWVLCQVRYDRTTGRTLLFQQGSLVGSSSSVEYLESWYGYWTLVPGYNLGAAEYNGPYTMPWNGYLSDFKLWL